ncbi:hypothetical protein [Methylosinus sp. PW1]|uniref:hypothetical protein n=1 Tax=Methylosinus sp. PW1 TaxID=107636 RepID=UPI0005672C27|nr:hypothetical protein [Methylosinus sp. PW1]
MARKFWKVVCAKRNGWTDEQVEAFWGEYAAQSDRIFFDEGSAWQFCDELYHRLGDIDGFSNDPEFDVEQIDEATATDAGFDTYSGVSIAPAEGDGSGNYYDVTLTDERAAEFDDFEPQTERDRDRITSIYVMFDPESESVELSGAYEPKSDLGRIERAIFWEFKDWVAARIAEDRRVEDDDAPETAPSMNDLDARSTPEILISDAEIVALVRRVVEDGRGGVLARAAQVPRILVYGNHGPNDRIAAALGYRRFSGWEPIPGWKDKNGFFGDAETAAPKAFIQVED